MNEPLQKKKRRAKRSLKKMLEIIEPFLPPKPRSKQLQCSEWEPSEIAVSEEIKTEN